MLSTTEENYLKAILHLTLEKGQAEVGTNELAAELAFKPATVNEMLKKLKEKKLVLHEKYGKITLTTAGKKLAVETIRKHRLWETFLFEKLHFTWDEVHEVAEQLEHIQSKKLIDQLDRFLGFPTVDPHGEIIPNARGEFKMRPKTTLSEVSLNEKCEVIGVKDDSAEFLQYADKLGCTMHAKIKVLAIQSFDQSMELEIKKQKVMVSSRFAENIYIHRLNR
ncbi:MAG: metal-dependent transcriptional regulator [Flavobacteriales bacterium]|jgi:DtxR family Mn-dependent transcriptional regulator